jgi:hypothetical protein
MVLIGWAVVVVHAGAPLNDHGLDVNDGRRRMLNHYRDLERRTVDKHRWWCCTFDDYRCGRCYTFDHRGGRVHDFRRRPGITR